jgi:ribosomal protein S18 acetylase RimI-like enzyme
MVFNMQIRFAEKKDVKEIAKLLLDVFKEPPFNEKASIDGVLKSVEFYLKTGRICVAIINTQIVGVLVFRTELYWEGPVIIPIDLAVKKDFRRQGIGRKLMKDLELHAKKNKFKKILFKTNKKSLAVSFYKKLGYEITPETINFEKKVK